jgi:hypothetical protein
MKEILLNLKDFKERVEALNLDKSLIRYVARQKPAGDFFVKLWLEFSIPAKDFIVVCRLPEIHYAKYEYYREREIGKPGEQTKRIKEYTEYYLNEFKEMFGIEPKEGLWEE